MGDSRGPLEGEPGKCFGRGGREAGPPTHTLPVGRPRCSQLTLEKPIDEQLKPEFGRYNIHSNNCSHYAEKVSSFLVGKALPNYILKSVCHARVEFLEHGPL